jgi:nucleoid-associated protein YgaU
MSFYQIQQLFIKELRSKLPQLVIGSFVVYFLASLVVTTTLNTLSNRKIEASNAFQNAQANIASTTQNIIRTFTTQPKQAVLPATTIQEAAPVVENTYIVQEGDSLWSIAEAKLGSGFNYTALIKSNTIANPSLLAIGEKIVIPVKTEVSGHILPEAAFTDIPSIGTDSTAVSQQVYSVQEGDSLWSIAEAKLGSGELWPRIADINELKNPRAIDPGDNLKLPQKN